MKKLLMMTIVAIFVLTIGCGESTNYKSTNDHIDVTEVNKENRNEKNDKSESEDTNENEVNATEKTVKEEVVKAEIEEEIVVDFDEQVVFNQDGIKIIAKGLEYDDLWGAEIKLLIENNTDQNIIVQTDSCSVNNIMLDPLFSADVAAGKKVNDSISFMSDLYEDYGIEYIASIEFEIVIIDAESWDGLYDHILIQLETNMFEEYEQVFYDEGAIAFDHDGIKLVVKGINPDGTFGTEVIIFAQNYSDVPVTIQASGISINGYMVDGMFSTSIAAGKVAYDTIDFFDSDLEENDITSIEDIELYFVVSQRDGWETLFETSIVSISFN